MAAFAEDLTFGDFSDLEVTEYHSLFGDPRYSSAVEFPWDVKNAHPSDGEESKLSYIQNPQTFPAKQSVANSAPLQVNNSASLPDASFAGQNTGGYYDVLPDSYDGGRAANEELDPNPKQWINQAMGIAQVDSQSSDGATGNDSQNEDASKKRRNKKRRDPDYYKKYYNRVEGSSSFENDSSTESTNVGVTDSKQFTSSESYIVVADSQSYDDAESYGAPDPSLEYNADEKNTERTTVCEQPVAAIPVADNPQRTVFAPDGNEPQYENYFESSANQDDASKDDASELDGAKIDSNVQMGEDIPQEPQVDQPGVVDAPLSPPAVPVIHISPSESISSATTPEGDSSGATTPAVVAEVEVVNPPAAQAPAPAPAPAGPPPVKSWASLFKAPSSGQSSSPVSTASAIVITTEAPSDESPTDNEYESPVPTNKDPYAKRLGEHLSRVSPSHHPMNLQPRGLINTANWCYINSILQALLSCPPFYHIMKNLPLHNGVRKSSSTPMIDAMYQFLKEFQELKGLSKRSSQDIRPGMPFEPINIYQMLSVAQTSLAVKQGRQEDAEEFLSCLLNGLHDEMTSLIQSTKEEDNQPADAKQNGPSQTISNGDVDGGHHDDGNEDEWEQVGPRNKSSITRRAQFSTSPLSKIFGGIMRSALHQHGSKESATLQPFFSLPLDIQSSDIWNVQDALDNLGNRESVHGFMSNKTKKEVEAFRRITLEELPPVLVLHLKRFLFDKSGGCQKLMKKVEYNMEIEISKDLISPNAKSRISFSQRYYKLFAVVYHTGKEASGGHYITDVYHVGTSGWIRYDDSVVKPVKPLHVTKPQSVYIPYLLFYRRKDLLTKPSS